MHIYTRDHVYHFVQETFLELTTYIVLVFLHTHRKFDCASMYSSRDIVQQLTNTDNLMFTEACIEFNYYSPYTYP